MRAVMRFIHVVLVAIAIACTSCRRATGKPTVRLEVVAVDDTTDPFGKDLPANLPRGLTIESETVRSAPGPEAEVRRVRYASLVDAADHLSDRCELRAKGIASISEPAKCARTFGRRSPLCPVAPDHDRSDPYS